MAFSTLSFILFFVLFIIFSPFVHEKAIASQMEHRKFGGAKETMAMRRNLEGNGNGSKIGVRGSTSHQSGQKNADKEPSKTKPDQTKTQGKIYLGYHQIVRGKVNTHPTSCALYDRCKRSSSP